MYENAASTRFDKLEKANMGGMMCMHVVLAFVVAKPFH
jgi:hypothetical protein